MFLTKFANHWTSLENEINVVAADAVAPCAAKPSATYDIDHLNRRPSVVSDFLSSTYLFFFKTIKHVKHYDGLSRINHKPTYR